MRSPAFYVARLPWQRRDALAPRSGVALAAPGVGRASEQRSFSVGPQVMASLRRASPRLRKYFKENYIPQVCEVLEPRGGGVRKGKKGQRIPRGGTGIWRREEVEVKGSEKGRDEVSFGQGGGLG